MELPYGSSVNYSIARGFVPLSEEMQNHWGWLRIGNPYTTEGYSNVALEVESSEVIPPAAVKEQDWDYPNERYRPAEAPVQFFGRVLLGGGREMEAFGVHFRSGLRQGRVVLRLAREEE